MAGRSLSRRALAANVYISEGRDRATIAKIVAAGTQPGVILGNEFVDPVYNRSGLTLASAEASKVEGAVLALCREALLRLDLRSHTATHPRLGVVDHVACNPLGAATCDEAAALALEIGRGLGGELKVPVFLYGAAREDRRPLAELRRSLGYFGGASKGEWSGLSAEIKAAIVALPADCGPMREVDERCGVASVGAVPWVYNYNLLITASGLTQEELMTRCRRMARSLSARGGGLAAVETMALPHESGVEVACNLLDAEQSPPQMVREKVLQLCEAEGVHLDSDYFTNRTPEELLDMVFAD